MNDKADVVKVDTTEQREALLIDLADMYARSKAMGFSDSLLVGSLQQSKVPADIATVFVKIAAAANDVATQIRGGGDRAALIARHAPSDMRPVFEKMVDTTLQTLSELKQNEIVTTAFEDLTFSSRPGQMELETWTWMRHEWPFLAIITVVFLIPFAAFFVLAAVHERNWVYLAATIAGLYYYTVERFSANVRNLYRSAYLAPGVVVSTEPPLVATLVNLARGLDADEANGYAVKIHRSILLTPEARKLGVGGIVPVICGFCDGPDPNKWLDIFPRVAQGGVSKEDAVDAALKRIPGEEWSDLDEAVSRLTREQLRTPGLYPVPEPTSAKKT